MHCVDLGESFPTSIYLQKSASIQPRTSPSKFGGKYSILFTGVLIIDAVPLNQSCRVTYQANLFFYRLTKQGRLRLTKRQQRRSLGNADAPEDSSGRHTRLRRQLLELRDKRRRRKDVDLPAYLYCKPDEKYCFPDCSVQPFCGIKLNQL